MYLWKNEISEITGLDKLKHIATLDLSNNKISEIKGLTSLDSLKQLNLYGNPIPSNLLAELEGVSEEDVFKGYGYLKHPERLVEYCRQHDK